jgi:hypothetical protein
MATLINRIQRAMLGSAGPEKVRALLAELAIPTSGSGEPDMEEVRRGFLRPISDEAILRNALANFNLTGGGSGDGQQALGDIRTAIFHSFDAAGTRLGQGLDDLLEPGDLAGGGGGGSPDWVPADAVIHIDLVGGTPQGRAWVQGTGEVAVDSLLGSDPNTESAVRPSAYSPAQLVTDGYRFYDPPPGGAGIAYPALIGALLTELLSGCTVRLQWITPGATSSGDMLEIVSASGANALEYYYSAGSLWVKGESWAGGYTAQINSILNAGTATSVNAFALTATSTRSEFAVNGSAVNAGVLIPATHWNDLVAAMTVLRQNDILQSITLYGPLPGTTGLSELSELTEGGGGAFASSSVSSRSISRGAI